MIGGNDIIDLCEFNNRGNTDLSHFGAFYTIVSDLTGFTPTLVLQSRGLFGSWDMK